MKYYGHVVLALARISGGRGALLGSSFPVSPKHLATAMHVVGPSDENLVATAPALENSGEYQDTTITNTGFINVKIVASDPIRDICILEVPGDSRAYIDYTIGGTDSLSPGSEVHVYGYPHMDFGRRIITMQRAHVGAKVLIPNSGVKSKHIVINTQMRPGQSGGPVFDAESGQLCAMSTGSYAPAANGSVIISGVDPTTLHQTGHAVSAEYIRDMIS
ncbi:serine protease [Actinacidiphila alni]|uniref:S1 family peptidase n=1 Tax=Actinacidiphila alni TaxID=380248 RepID=UPI0033FCAE24